MRRTYDCAPESTNTGRNTLRDGHTAFVVIYDGVGTSGRRPSMSDMKTTSDPRRFRAQGD